MLYSLGGRCFKIDNGAKLRQLTKSADPLITICTYKSKTTEAEFQMVLHRDTIQPFKSSFVFPLHMIPTSKACDWRPRGEFNGFG